MKQNVQGPVASRKHVVILLARVDIVVKKKTGQALLIASVTQSWNVICCAGPSVPKCLSMTLNTRTNNKTRPNTRAILRPFA